MQVESEGEAAACAAAVLTPPLSLEGGLAAELRPANLVQRVLSLFRNVSPGSDLSHFQVSPTVCFSLFPKNAHSTELFFRTFFLKSC
jgi:hypothetical protein